MKLWMWWIFVVVVVSGPWYGVVREPQWGRVTWLPFHGFEDKPRDVAANFLLFLPFGWSFAMSRPRTPRTVVAALAWSAAVSLAVEIPQLFYRLRDPSATDVFMAMCGSGAASLAFEAFHRGDARGTTSRREAREAGGQ
jgi:glycopeptide antibiotics resistance protein